MELNNLLQNHYEERYNKICIELLCDGYKKITKSNDIFNNKKDFIYAMDDYLFTKIASNKHKFKFIREFLGCFQYHNTYKRSIISQIGKIE
ncbi:MAG TPA: hypothetical protein PLE45_04035 [Spirochaetota bacterium]|nr:hypothetical protein [Spirochaetota bacterium]HOL56402.1 hypothetical protein [Spirochaetota bacterium]HPP03886.1 hypothetical protein [Spirochaetota bacterium]